MDGTESKLSLDRPAKAIISRVLADSVTPLLMTHGFDRRGRRLYDRIRDGRRELVGVENEWNNRYGGSFTIRLGIFLTEVDSVVSLYPLQTPPELDECHILCGIGDVEPDGRIHTVPAAARGHDWTFDARTDLSALGADVRHWVEHNGLSYFDTMKTGAGILAWLDRYPTRWPNKAALAMYAGEPAQAQAALDNVVSTWPNSNQTRRQAAQVAARLGLTAPALTDAPALTAVFRLDADTTPQDRYDAFHELDDKFRQYDSLLRDLLAVDDPEQLYHLAECDGLTCTVKYYGADPEDLLAGLRRAFARLSETFIDITWQANPA